MNTIIQKIQNGYKKYCTTPISVLNNYSPEDVGRAMIENGKQRQPFYIFSLDAAHNRIQHFRKLMPRIKIFYAMKSNDTEMMLKFAISQGLGFDCASPAEIYKLRQLNVNPKSILYAMPIKTPEQMVYARETGVKYTTFDSAYELKKLKEYWPDARLLIRIRVDSDSLIKLSDKFGCDFESEAINLLEAAADLGLKVVGVSFQVGSVCKSVDSYITALRQARVLFDHEAIAGRSMKIVDIGDGFLSDRSENIDHLSELINAALEDLFPDPDIQVIAEPGAYISDSAFTLYCSISNVRRVKKNGRAVNMIYINDGIYGTMRYSVPWQKITKFKKSTEKDMGELEDAILWGPSCDSTDQIVMDSTIQLPRCMPLEWLIIENHGSYTITFATRFSTLEIPLVRSVISTELWHAIKDNVVFSSPDFVVQADMSTPLPMTLPPQLQRNKIHEHTHIPTLKI
ncbi:hypothetical protein K1T71_005230 [Dendrolimus kikuchii]|uniref:Uncharacterized protein n=1 Tax=Dendrolimus kikuchii TaxID=765133 RepID=A0ACC1D7E8_9NEOP|nr:hypothetical protein K1T71_005230 [Dendrolimus kikuchii]